jgi:catechol 2,3-dioxygenase-like lactoylglutathione lyase family enzyme
MAKVSGINHITLAVSDLGRSFAFYCDLLGCRPIATWDRGAYIAAGDTWLCLTLDNKLEGPRPDYTHLAFNVSASEFESFSSTIKASGAKVWQENTSEGPSLYFLDPDGHRLEIHNGDWQSRLASWATKPPSGFKSFV